MPDTGYDAARAWLKANAPEWLILRSDTTLEAGPFLGAPTEQRVKVTLCEADAAVKQSLRIGYVELDGEGRTMLEAVQRAVGQYSDAPSD